MKQSVATLEKIVSLCKRRGFVYQSSEIYGGLNGMYDFGPLGTALKNNIRASWLTSLAQAEDNILLIEGSLIAPERVWEASGHVQNFHDPMVDCLNCKHRFRADHINLEKSCPNCGKKQWTEVRTFNMMFQTNVGAAENNSTKAYLRPESAQAIFINFKNVLSSNRVKIPFGIAQIGKAFRNEINPQHFLFRMREFEQMEMEWFCTPDSARGFFDSWCKKRLDFYRLIGLDTEKIRIRPHEKTELSHYSECTSDVEYYFPFGWKEVEGIAYRGDFDLKQHSEFSGKDLAVFDEETKTSYLPHVVETSVGTDRLFLTVLFDSYDEDTVEGEVRTVLHLAPRLAPVKAAILPLTKKQLEPAHALFGQLKKKGLAVEFDVTGSIGKRYRRQDEIGTPVCFTYDFESEQDGCVTARNRDTTKQERISIDKVEAYITDLLKD